MSYLRNGRRRKNNGIQSRSKSRARPEILNLEKIGNSDFLIFDNFSLFSESGLNTVIAALREKQESKVCFGISDKTLIDENLKNLKWLSQNKIDLIYGNNNELSELRNKVTIKSKNILESFGKKGAGLNGSLVPAPKIEVINTNGAGDALIGSFLAFKIVLMTKQLYLRL